VEDLTAAQSCKVQGRIFLSAAPPPREVWLLTRREAAGAGPVRLARDFRIDLFAQHRDLFEAE
jgi:hypothetical protein